MWDDEAGTRYLPGITILLHPSHDMTITSHVVRMSKWTYLPTNSGRYRGKTCNWDLNPPTAMLVQYLSLTDSDTVTTELLYLVPIVLYMLSFSVTDCATHSLPVPWYTLHIVTLLPIRRLYILTT